jgi:hypothetical protein
LENFLPIALKHMAMVYKFNGRRTWESKNGTKTGIFLNSVNWQLWWRCRLL